MDRVKIWVCVSGREDIKEFNSKRQLCYESVESSVGHNARTVAHNRYLGVGSNQEGICCPRSIVLFMYLRFVLYVVFSSISGPKQ